MKKTGLHKMINIWQKDNLCIRGRHEHQDQIKKKMLSFKKNPLQCFLWMKVYYIITVRIFHIIVLDVCLHKIKQWKSWETELQQGKQTNEFKIITKEISLFETKFAPYSMGKPLSLVYLLFPTAKSLMIFLIV